MTFLGIQLKGFIVGILFAYFLVPFVQRALMSRRPMPAT